LSSPEAAVERALSWVTRLARAGNASKAIVYLLVGGFALAAALGIERRPTGTTGVFRTVLKQPFGAVALMLLAGGLFVHALWELFRALRDPDNEASQPRDVFKRLGWIVAAAGYTSLGCSALRILGGWPMHGEDAAARNWTRLLLLTVPLGPWLLTAIGVGIIVTGSVFLRKGWTADLDHYVDLSGLSPWVRVSFYVVGRLGMVARGVVWSVIGACLIVAATTGNPNQALAIHGALIALARQSYGPWLLGMVSVGFIAYGLYELFVAWRRRFHVDVGLG